MRLHHSIYGRLFMSMHGRRFLVVLSFLLLVSSIYARAGGGGVWNTRTGQVYDRIQPAINEAAPGDTIIVNPGVYNEALRINKALTLLGVAENDQRPLIAPNPGFAALTIVNPPRGSEVTIDGFDMQVSTNEEAILSEAAHLKLYNSGVKGDGRGVAVRTYIPSGIILESNVIENFRRGLASENDNNWFVYDVLVRSNIFDSIVEPLLLINCPDAVVDDNLFRNDPDRVRYDRSSAITLHRSPNSLISNNIICAHHFGIYVIGGSGTTIDGNNISDDLDTDGSGLFVVDSSDVRVTSNRVEDVEYLMTFNSALNAVLRNNSLSHSNYGVQNSQRYDPQYLLDARYNWWGASDGPSFMGHGRGVPVNENTLFEPWLDREPKLDDRACRR